MIPSDQVIEMTKEPVFIQNVMELTTLIGDSLKKYWSFAKVPKSKKGTHAWESGNISIYLTLSHYHGADQVLDYLAGCVGSFQTKWLFTHDQWEIGACMERYACRDYALYFSSIHQGRVDVDIFLHTRRWRAGDKP